MEKEKPCNFCGVIKPYSLFKQEYRSKSGVSGMCKACHAAYVKERSHKSGKTIPYNESKTCSSYFGVYVAERLLQTVFNSVVKMPMNFHGYDFICGKQKKIDSKCSVIKIRKGHCNSWAFDIERNTTADYFACIAFNNRTDIAPLHFWLIPGIKISHLRCLRIGVSNFDKWDIYKQPIDKLLVGCSTLKGDS